MIYDKLMECFAGEERSVASLTATATADSDIQFIWSEINNIEDEYHHLAQCLLTSIVQERIMTRLLHAYINEKEAVKLLG